MNTYLQLTLGLDWEPADESLEELLSRVAEESHPYDGRHAYHVAVEMLNGSGAVGEETDDDQA